MLGYNDLYETLRKEKYSEALQPLPKKFLEEFKEYIHDSNQAPTNQTELFSDSQAKSKKQLENAISIFRELMLKRKRKILNLVFVATETGIMKRDYENMLPHEREVFDILVKTIESGDNELNKALTNKQESIEQIEKMILFKQDIEQFIDHEGKAIGPFKSGELVNINSEIAKILESEGKATFIDES
jgi:DNA replication initiation complex subunit (GINS family)